MLGGTSSGMRMVTLFFTQTLQIVTVTKAAKKAVRSPLVPKNPVAKPSAVGSAANINRPTIEASNVDM